MMHVVQIGGDRTMGVSLIHAEISKVLDQIKIGRDVTMQGGEGQIQLQQASHLADFGGDKGNLLSKELNLSRNSVNNFGQDDMPVT